ncbi:MAG: 4Fe-4S binding protein [Betaproteobacteria bacterium]|nr:4Fe-4S binding protein [Betaproteobacteria bacterium]
MQNPVASTASRRRVAPPPAAVGEQLESLVGEARAAGFQVEGLALARALAGATEIARLRESVFNTRALAYLKSRVRRIEFIAEGPLPPELLLEPAAKSQPIYRQVVDYSLCKGCRLCIQVCPKRVYSDDGFGKPDEQRRDEECTGNAQCAQCLYICPERAISLVMSNPMYESTLFVQLENAYAAAEASQEATADFALVNPLAVDEALVLEAFDAHDLVAAHRVLDAAGFFPIIETMGVTSHFVDARDPAATLSRWAHEHGRAPDLVRRAVELLYQVLPGIEGLRQGQYDLARLLHGVIDEILHAGIELETAGGLKLVKDLLEEARLAQTYLGAKRRPIGGLLPPGTSTAWKTPYGNELPVYTRLEKCLGPECALCVTHCPEGSGGETSAIRMIPLLPLGTMPALVRGLRAYLLHPAGGQARIEDMEDLFGKQPFAFEVDAEYCKSCGICISCCPHDVIEGAPRSLELGANA